MSIIDELDCDALIARLAGPLLPQDRVAFRRAAEEALAQVPCQGEGAIYRTVAALQRSFRTPPSDDRAQWEPAPRPRPSKLRDGPPIEHLGDGRAVRYRKRAGR